MTGNTHFNFARDQAGSSAVEFGLLLPLVLFVILGALDLSLVLYTYNSFEHAARDVARRVSTDQISTTDPNNCKIAITQQLPSWVDPIPVSVSCSPTPSSSTGNVIYDITITSPMSNATPLKFLSTIYQGKSLYSKVSMRHEAQ